MNEYLKTETFAGEQSKAEFVAAQQLLEMKRTFVRYISHEIRTPLNTCTVGLRLVHDIGLNMGIFESASPSDEELEKGINDFISILELIDEIKESCEVAVDILDDILLYEKMESGSMQVERKEEPALGVVYEVRFISFSHSFLDTSRPIFSLCCKKISRIKYFATSLNSFY
jgi:signal transduction histidine kinase